MNVDHMMLEEKAAERTVKLLKTTHKAVSRDTHLFVLVCSKHKIVPACVTCTRTYTHKVIARLRPVCQTPSGFIMTC